ncbi:MAG TPA: hypothetical protein VGI38_05765 [Puia sp.]
MEQVMDQIKLYNILRTDLHLTDDKAADFVSALGAITSMELDRKIQALATKDDLRTLSLATKDDLRALSIATKNDILDLNKKIYLIGLVQFIALVTSMLAIVKFMR